MKGRGPKSPKKLEKATRYAFSHLQGEAVSKPTMRIPETTTPSEDKGKRRIEGGGGKTDAPKKKNFSDERVVAGSTTREKNS